MYSPSFSMTLQERRRRRRPVEACSSSVVLPLMPSWFERTVAIGLAGAVVLSIVAAIA